jgi:hypothetical protein
VGAEAFQIFLQDAPRFTTDVEIAYRCLSAVLGVRPDNPFTTSMKKGEAIGIALPSLNTSGMALSRLVLFPLLMMGIPNKRRLKDKP